MQNNDILDAVSIDGRGNVENILRDNSARGRYALVFLWICIGMAVLLLVSGVLQLMLLQKANEAGISEEEITMNDTRQVVAVVLYMSVYLTSTVMFIRWFRRAYYNLGSMGIVKQFTDGWAAGGWFVPIMNFGRPVKIMYEIWNENMAVLTRMDPGLSRLNNGKALIAAWWTFWLLAGVMDRVEWQITKNAVSMETLFSATIVGIIATVLTIIAGLLAVMVVQRVMAMEKELYERQDMLVQPVRVTW